MYSLASFKSSRPREAFTRNQTVSKFRPSSYNNEDTDNEGEVEVEVK